MTRPTTSFRFARSLAAICVAGLSLPAAAARADTALPDSALSVRNAIVAMSLADAALPYAVAISASAYERVVGGVELAPDTSAAMAAMRPSSARRGAAAPYSSVALERRAPRPVREPFLLMLGVGY